MGAVIRVAARRSRLAMTQAASVCERLSELTGREWEMVPVTSEGDTIRGPLAGSGRTGVFVAAVRQAVIDGRADIAVHSLKDLPTEAAPGIELAAVPGRADPRDALVIARDGGGGCSQGPAWVARLGPGARIGTGSARRAAQMRRARPDVDVVPIRGNVDTRIERIREGDLDAVVVAMAGLERLGLSEDAVAIPEQEMIPAAGQGALAVEMATGRPGADGEVVAALATMDDPGARAAVTAERSLLAELQADCSSPIGALAWATSPGSPTIRLAAVAISLSGGTEIRMQATGSAGHPGTLGRTLAREMLNAGAATVLGR